MGFLFMLAIKMTVDNFAACYYFSYRVASIVMSFKIMPYYCVLKGSKTEKNMLKKNLGKIKNFDQK